MDICIESLTNNVNLSAIVVVYVPLYMYISILCVCIFYSILKMFTQNKEERKRIEKALDSSGLASGKVCIRNDFILHCVLL